MKQRYLLQNLFAAFALNALTTLAWSAPPIAPIEPPAAEAFDAAQVARGAQLATLGNCKDCHTVPEKKPYAGGRAVKTPFGTVYGTNLTPEAETGIGRWSEAAFARAMREGVDREGRHLYPAFPYEHFSKVTDADLKALYAYLMTREPVRAEAPPNKLIFPFNIRPLIGVWKTLFFDRRDFVPDPKQSAEWNRGAYLAEGLGHCGACHTPRNSLGAEKKDQPYAGGDAEGWHAPALNAASPAPAPWTPVQLYAYLRHGLDDVHSVPAGPMAPVVHNLAQVPDEEVRAIATFVASLAGQRTTERAARQVDAPNSAAPIDQTGAAIYASACAVCHDNGRAMSSADALHLSLSTSVAIPTPRNLIHIILEGITPPQGEPGRWMPSFAGAFTPAQLTALVAYLRTEFGKAPPWTGVEDEVAKIIGADAQRLSSGRAQ
jgi:mono/diheme cytochrome c family protein